jgi:hypothetical protein
MKLPVYLVLLAGLAVAAAGCEKATVSGPEGKAMTLVVPSSVTVLRGQSQTVEVKVNRDTMNGTVRVSIANLPKGVTVTDSTKTVEVSGPVTFVLEASKTAGLVANQVVRVTLEGSDGMKAAEEFRLTVKD